MGLSVYPWRNCAPKQITTLRKPLSESTVAIITSAGFYIKNVQPKFDNTIIAGDFTHREIPSDVKIRDLYESHRSGTFDHSGIRENPSSALPIPHIQKLVDDNVVGKLSNLHFSVMGSITAPGRYIKYTIPHIINRLKECNVCIQSDDVGVFSQMMWDKKE